jgi:heat shock protein HtpX
MNYTRTALLLALLTAIFVAMGAVIGGQSGLIVAFGIALVMNLVSLWKSDSVVLRMHKAEEVTAATGGQFYEIVAEMARRADLPMPRVYIMHNPQPNAFATGRSPKNSAVCASTGLLDMLTPEEVAGVMAHELAHIKNRDTLTMTMAATIGGAISMMAQYLQIGAIFGRSSNGRGGWLGSLLTMIVAPIAAMMVQMAISRSREYQADRLGAMICGNPRWLASALVKINEAARRIANPSARQFPASAHLFIVNPLRGDGMDNLFSTHPNIDNRIAELEKLAQEMAASGPRAGAGPEVVDAPWLPSQQRRETNARRNGPWG